MSTERRFERAARTWLEAGPERAPERAVEAALLRIETTDQVRDVRVLGRSLVMNRMLALAAAALVVAVGGFALIASRPAPNGPGGQSPAPSATATPTVAASVAPSPTVVDSATVPSGVEVRFTVSLPFGWTLQSSGPASALEILYQGSPQLPESQWWGGGPWEADKAGVVRKSDVNTPAITGSNPARDPFPADFYTWLTGLPGVTTVLAPTPATIGGVTGTRFTVATPQMHPLIYLEGDTGWLGGGATGLDPAMTREFTVVKVGGKTLVFEYEDSPDMYATRAAQLHAIYDTVVFK